MPFFFEGEYGLVGSSIEPDVGKTKRDLSSLAFQGTSPFMRDHRENIHRVPYLIFLSMFLPKMEDYIILSIR
jgi:hypothetical protein